MTAYYFISGKPPTSIEQSHRAGQIHHRIHHGFGYYPSQETKDWVHPKRGHNPEPLHVLRSGRVLPDVFWPSVLELVVSEKVMSQMSHLEGVEFAPVVIERLVDLPMPPLGVESEAHRKAIDATSTKEFMLHAPEFSMDSQPKYFTVLSDVVAEVAERKGISHRKVFPITGSLYQRQDTAPFFHPLVMNGHDIISGSWKILSTKGFHVIAPYLDLDYFAIGMFDTDWPNQAIHYKGLPEAKQASFLFPF